MLSIPGWNSFYLSAHPRPEQKKNEFLKTLHRTWSSSVMSINAGTLILGDFVALDDEIHAPTSVRPERKRTGSQAGVALLLPGHTLKGAVT